MGKRRLSIVPQASVKVTPSAGTSLNTLEENDDSAEKQARRESNVHLVNLRRKSFVGESQKLSAVDPLMMLPYGQLSSLSQDDLAANYDQWMKIATDNKINTNNSWNVQLIDYFHELGLMRDGDAINFQKASCTLDGCVKVYTTRVDAILSETNLLLSGLSTSENSNAKQFEARAITEEEGDEDGKPTRKKASSNRQNTLEKNPANLLVKKLDKEFSVDPLFRKTCADFDEGGASGLLLNHLCIFDNGKIVFDASDISATAHAVLTEEEEQFLAEVIDVSLFSQFLPADPRKMLSMTLCPSLNGYKLGDNHIAWPELSESKFKKWRDTDDDQILLSSEIGMEIDGDVPEIVENDNVEEERDRHSFAGADNEYDDVDDYYFEAAAAENYPDYPIENLTATMMDNHINELDDQENVRQASGNVKDVQFLAATQFAKPAEVYSYFDAASLKTWAGPAHWKKSFYNKKLVVTGKTKKAVEKEAVFIDFSHEATPIDSDLFGKKVKSTKIKDVGHASLLLPRDVKYSWNDASRLFTKHSMQLRQRTAAQTYAEDNHDDFSEASFNGGDGVDHYEPDPAEAPFPGFTQATQGDVVGLTQFQPTQAFNVNIARPDVINFSKKAKKVDVQVLKDNIWNQLDAKTVDHSKVHKFTDIMGSVEGMYTKQKSDDITVPFYFICLLHLANEKGLSIEGNADMCELTVTL